MKDVVDREEEAEIEIDPEVLLAEVDSLNEQIAYYKQKRDFPRLHDEIQLISCSFRGVDIEIELRTELAEQLAGQFDEMESKLEEHYQQELRVTPLGDHTMMLPCSNYP